MRHASAPTTALTIDLRCGNAEVDARDVATDLAVGAVARDLTGALAVPCAVVAWHPATLAVLAAHETSPAGPELAIVDANHQPRPRIATGPEDLVAAPEVDDLLARPEGGIVLAGGASPALRALGRAWRARELVVVALAADGDHHGVVVVGLTGRAAHPAGRSDLLRRVRSAAAYGALRLERVHLLDALAHQRRSDPATGLLTDQGLVEELATHSPTTSIVAARVHVPELSALAAACGRVGANDARRQLGARLVTATHGRALVGRGDGERFLLVAKPGVHVDDAAAEDDLIRAATEAFDVPLTVGRIEVRLQAVVGVAAGSTLELAWQGVEEAMAGSPTRCRGADVRRASERHVDLAGELALTSDLAAAIRAEEIEAWFQPQVDLATGQVVGVEALARWWRNGVSVPPSRFIVAAERGGLIEDLDLAVLRAACRSAAAWPAACRLRVAVNLSGRTLLRPDLDTEILGALAAAGLDPTRLEVEITESVAELGGDRGRRTLHRLRAAGVQVAIDDFGTGFSSLARIDQLPVDRLKLDRSFVSGLPHRGQRLVDAVVAMAGLLGLEVLAEGVETEAQLDAVRNAGVAAYQGWYLAPALDPSTTARLLHALGWPLAADDVAIALARGIDHAPARACS